MAVVTAVEVITGASLVLATVIIKLCCKVSVPSVTANTTECEPTSSLLAVPDNIPELASKLSHVGKVGADKVKVSELSTSVALKV